MSFWTKTFVSFGIHFLLIKGVLNMFVREFLWLEYFQLLGNFAQWLWTMSRPQEEDRLVKPLIVLESDTLYIVFYDM